RQAEQLEGAEERLDLAEFTIRALPVEWANLLLQTEQAGAEQVLRGGNLTGQMVVSAEAGAIFFRMVEPLQADGIGLFSEGEPLFADLSFEADGAGSFQDGRLEATVEPLQFYYQGQSFLSASGTFDSEA